MILEPDADNPIELRLLDVENALIMTDRSALSRDGIHYNTEQGSQWINDAFHRRQKVRTMVNPVARGSPAGSVR